MNGIKNILKWFGLDLGAKRNDLLNAVNGIIHGKQDVFHKLDFQEDVHNFGKHGERKKFLHLKEDSIRSWLLVQRRKL